MFKHNQQGNICFRNLKEIVIMIHHNFTSRQHAMLRAKFVFKHLHYRFKGYFINHETDWQYHTVMRLILPHHQNRSIYGRSDVNRETIVRLISRFFQALKKVTLPKTPWYDKMLWCFRKLSFKTQEFFDVYDYQVRKITHTEQSTSAVHVSSW